MGLALLAIVLVACGLVAGEPKVWVALGLVGTLLVAVLGPLGWWLAKRSSNGATGLEVRPEGIVVGGTLVIPRGEIFQAQVTDDFGTAVILQCRGGLRPRIDVMSRDEGRALVEALGFGVEHSTARYEFDPMPLGLLSVLWVVAGGLVALCFRESPLLLPLALAMAATFALQLRAQKLTIGLDGLTLEGRRGSRFISYEGLERVHIAGLVLVLTLRGGEQVELSVRQRASDQGFSQDFFGFPTADAYLATVGDRILQARATRGRAKGAMASALVRGERPLRSWLDELRGLLDEKRASFRRGAVSADQLWAAVEDATAEPSIRVAGAVALAPHLDAQGKARLRVAAAAVASPDLRAAIEECAADELAQAEALERAVSRVVSS
jgi:hypothetical protein